jgi:hypothetical protein
MLDQGRAPNPIFGKDLIIYKKYFVHFFLFYLETLFSSDNQHGDLIDAFPSPLSDRLPVCRILNLTRTKLRFYRVLSVFFLSLS